MPYSYTYFKPTEEEFLGLTRDEWKQVLKSLLGLAASAAVSILLSNYTMKLMKNITNDESKTNIVKKLEDHFKIVQNNKQKTPTNTNKLFTRSKNKFKMPYKFNNYELKLAEKVIFNTFYDTNKKFEHGFSLIGGLEEEIKIIKSSVINPLFRREMIKKMLKEANNSNQSDTSISKQKYQELNSAFKNYKTAQGVLLHGPPGCGKTQLVKALAAEAQIPIILVDSSDLMSKWLGDSNKLVTALWSLAEKLSPCIIFMDECDSILGDRESNSNHEVTKQMLSIFLAKWEGMQMNSEKDNQASITLVGATNRQKSLDAAILRRFTTKIEIKEPTFQQLEEILKIHLSANSTNIQNISQEDFENLAKICKNYKFTGSDIRLVAEISVSSRIDKFMEESSFEKNDFFEPEEDDCEIVSLPGSVVKEEPDDIELLNFSNVRECIERVRKMKSDSGVDVESLGNLYC